MFSFLVRNRIIFLTALLLGLLFAFVWAGRQEASFHTTIFTSVANQNLDSSTQENEQAATYFGETLMGWFRNPAFTEKIYEKARATGNLSAHKQERQNLIVEIDAASETETRNLAQATLLVLESEINQFNRKTDNAYVLLNLGMTTYQNPLKKSVLIVAIMISIMLSAVVGILVWEALRGRLSLPMQLTTYCKQENILNLDLNKNHDAEFLALACLKENCPVIMAGVDFDQSDMTVQTALKIDEMDQNTILVDGDLKEKKLHQNLGLSQMMKNLKGLTDRVKQEEELKHFIHQVKGKNLNFLAAGSGQNAIWNGLAEQLEEHKTILIHTILPQNYAVLNLEEYTLFLFVKMGKTKLSSLAQIKALQGDKTKIVIV